MVLVVLCAVLFFTKKGKKFGPTSIEEKFVSQLMDKQYLSTVIEKDYKTISQNGGKDYHIQLSGILLNQLAVPYSLYYRDVDLSGNVVFHNRDFDASVKTIVNGNAIEDGQLVKNDSQYMIFAPFLQSKGIAFHQETIPNLLESFSPKYLEVNCYREGIQSIKKYALAAFAEVENTVKEEPKQEITIQQKSYKTDVYHFEVTQKQWSQMISAFLTKIEEDPQEVDFLANVLMKVTNYSGDASAKEESITIVKALLTSYAEKMNENTSDEMAISVRVFVKDGDTIKTEILYAVDGNNAQYALEAVDGYISFTTDMKEHKATYTYESEKTDTSFEAKLVGQDNQLSMNESVTLGSMSFTNNESSNEVRKIESLNVEDISKYSKADYQSFWNRMTDRFFEVAKKVYAEKEPDVLETGDFKLNDPESRVNALAKSIEIFDKITIGMTKEEVLNMLGEPGKTYPLGNTEFLYWYQDDEKTIDMISVMIGSNGKVEEVINGAASSSKANVQISAELNTQIEDLRALMPSIKIPMNKEEVIQILGDAYITVNKNNTGYTKLRWYDKNENSVTITFMENNEIMLIGNVEAGVSKH